MRTKHIIALASPLVAAAVALSPAAMSQAAAATTDTSATTGSDVARFPMDDAAEGRAKGASDGRRDGLTDKCDYRHSYAPAKATPDYMDAYSLAYRTNY
ncbi:hypothetical protein, partial [Streptomyces sp. NPDC002164]